MKNPFVYNVLVCADDKGWFIYTQGDSIDFVERKAEEFKENTPATNYQAVLITFVFREHSLNMWEVYRHWE